MTYNTFHEESRNAIAEEWREREYELDYMKAHIIDSVVYELMHNENSMNDFIQGGLRAYCLQTFNSIHYSSDSDATIDNRRFYLSDSQYDEINNPAMIVNEFSLAFSMLLDYMGGDIDMRNALMDALYSHLEEDYSEDGIDLLYASDNRIAYLNETFRDMTRSILSDISSGYEGDI